MNQKAAPAVGKQVLNQTYQPAQGTMQEQRVASMIPGSEMRASRRLVPRRESCAGGKIASGLASGHALPPLAQQQGWFYRSQFGATRAPDTQFPGFLF